MKWTHRLMVILRNSIFLRLKQKNAKLSYCNKQPKICKPRSSKNTKLKLKQPYLNSKKLISRQSMICINTTKLNSARLRPASKKNTSMNKNRKRLRLSKKLVERRKFKPMRKLLQQKKFKLKPALKRNTSTIKIHKRLRLMKKSSVPRKSKQKASLPKFKIKPHRKFKPCSQN